jgi:hypothetical protein
MARIEIKRRQNVWAGRRSAGDLTDGEWAPIAPAGRPRSSAWAMESQDHQTIWRRQRIGGDNCKRRRMSLQRRHQNLPAQTRKGLIICNRFEPDF